MFITDLTKSETHDYSNINKYLVVNDILREVQTFWTAYLEFIKTHKGVREKLKYLYIAIHYFSFNKDLFLDYFNEVD